MHDSSRAVAGERREGEAAEAHALATAAAAKATAEAVQKVPTHNPHL